MKKKKAEIKKEIEENKELNEELKESLKDVIEGLDQSFSRLSLKENQFKHYQTLLWTYANRLNLI